MKQCVNTKAHSGANRAEDQCPIRVLAEAEVRVAHSVRKRDARPRANGRADERSVQQRITPLRRGSTSAEHQCGENDESHEAVGH